MKTISKLTAIAIILCAELLLSCEDLIYINGNPGPDPVMGIDPSFLHIPAEGDSAIHIQISIYSPIEGAEVTAVEKCDWFTVKELNNERAILAVEPNPADTTRYGYITFSYNNEECSCLTAAQEGRE
jgi:hypothetical protein